MKRTTLWIGITLGLLLVSQRYDLHAAQRSQVPLYGIPIVETCDSWTADSPARTSVHAQVQAAWVFGFVSGAASSTAMLTAPDSVAFPDDLGTIEMTEWMTKYCADHPNEMMAVATMKLLLYLNGRAKR